MPRIPFQSEPRLRSQADTTGGKGQGHTRPSQNCECMELSYHLEIGRVPPS
jgi:hypothetical protein